MLTDHPTVPSQQYTAEACLACKNKKRKCDKQFPACSRCQRVDQECLYGSAADGVYGKIVRVTSEPSFKAREITGAISAYIGLGIVSSVQQTQEAMRQGFTLLWKVQKRRQLFSSQHVFSMDAPPMSVIPLRLPYPVESQPYIPSLVRSFQDRMGLSELVVETDSLAHHLRSSWIQHAMADPCMMHATLYAASAHLDTLRDTTAGSLIANPVTLYHQTETIAAVNARIVSGHVLDDGTIASVLLLVITGSLQKDNGATEAHRRGLLHMVSVRGGLEKLGFDGFLARMIQMNMVLPAVVFDKLDGLVVDGMFSPAASSNLPALTLERLDQSTTGSPSVRFHMTAIFAHVWELLLAVDCGEGGNGQYLFDFATARFILDGECKI
ncbi:hypothetical protein BJX66DRAFT_345292 [Aspergillus keveii]|uniref:Zn(2)-C6 fungal-type domain-containing protein n=1 Tax=Aspergillus keveii TaxID=714993 RepID=A0ABR4FJ25_9EURO